MRWIDFNEHEGWTSLFDGKALNGCPASCIHGTSG
jgi:hypothetical protein